VIQDTQRDGRLRLRYRAPGSPARDLPTPFGSDAFWRAYASAKTGQSAPVDDGTTKRRKAATGSLRALVDEYYRRASDYVAADPLTQSDKRGVIEGVLKEQLAPDNPLLFEDCPVKSFTPRHAVVLRDRKAALPNAANKRLRYLKMVFDWAVEARLAESNPLEKVKKLKVPRKGFHAWTPDEVRQFEAKHPIGTKARLALALMAFTGLRVSDLRQVGKQHIRDGWLELPQHKNRRRAPKIIRVPVLPELQQIIDQSPTGDSTLLVTEFGHPFSIKGAANKVKDWCVAAGLPHCSAHGVRKAGASVAAENGATEAQLMAIFGWEDAKQAVLYTRSARQKKLAGSAMHLMIPKGESTEEIIPQFLPIRHVGEKQAENPTNSTQS
jgi:integrase